MGKPGRLSSFTLIELLTVILIIGILAALTLAAASGVMKTAARDRARSEITAISTAAESYKVDNGTYPQYDLGATNSYSALPTTAGGSYQLSSEILYENLSGQTNYATMVPGVKIYMTFKTSQLGNYASGNTYIQDPFGYSYGYSTGSPTTGGVAGADVPYNGVGFFDLWSTGGDISGTNANNGIWINNWSGS
jgi:prepilin-type N-terminal cleavage/methylation domain-containing protein